MIRTARIVSFAIGAAVLGWQGVNAANGRFVHFFLIPDVVIGCMLIAAGSWPSERAAAVAMLAGHAAMAAVFLCASGGRLLVEPEKFDAGTRLATFGMVLCALIAGGIGRWLARRSDGSSTSP